MLPGIAAMLAMVIGLAVPPSWAEDIEFPINLRMVSDTEVAESSDLEACGVACTCCQPCCKPCACKLCCGCGWTVTTDLMFLRRTDADDYTIITDQISGAEVANVKDLDFDHEVVPRIFLTRNRQDFSNPGSFCCFYWEIGYFGSDSPNASDTPVAPTSPVFQAPGTPLASSGPGNLFRLNYGTDFHSAEFNIRKDWSDCVGFLIGYRWFELSDDLFVDEVGNATGDILQVDTNNHMHGFQVGTDLVLLQIGTSYRFHIDTYVRAGLLFNSADQNTYAPGLSPFAPTFVDRINAEDDHTSFVGELGITGVYEVTDRIALRAGYSALWLEGVALAPDQIPVTDLAVPGSAVLDTGGSLFFHGALAGLQFRF